MTNEIPSGAAKGTYHLIVRPLPHAFENALNQAVSNGWTVLPESFHVVVGAQTGHIEYAILIRRD